MLRPVIVSTVVLCGLSIGADGVEAKSPGIADTPKITLPPLPAASSIPVLPRSFPLPRQDESADDGGKLLENNTPAGAGNAPSLVDRWAPPASSPNDPHVPEDLKGVLDSDAAELARLRERLEEIEGLNDDGSFDPLARLFPGTERADPRDLLPGSDSHTTGGRDDGDQPSIEDIMAGFGNAGSGDGRSEDAGGSPPEWNDRGGDVGERGVGAFGGGLGDPSGEVSQRGRGRWTRCGAGCVERTTVNRRGEVAVLYERRDRTGTTTQTTERGSGKQTTRFESSHWAYPSYTSRHENGVEWRDYDDPDRQDEIITRRDRGDGTDDEQTTPVAELDIGPEPDPDDDQPAEEGYGSGGTPERGHVGAYNVTCSAMGCTYSPLSKEEIMSDMGMEINPGGIDRVNPADLSRGPRVGPGAVTDPDPENLGGSGGRRPPVEPGCGGGGIRC